MHGDADVNHAVAAEYASFSQIATILLRRLGAASAVLICLLMVSSPFSMLLTGEPGIGIPSSESSDLLERMISPTESATSSSLAVWDWDQLADENGLVSVIVKITANVGGVRSEAGAEASIAATDQFVSEFASSKIHSYSLAFDGFSAKVRLDALKALQALGSSGIEVYPDVTVQATLTESVYQIGADQVWTRTDSQGLYVTGKGVVVAVVDTGVDYTHPDLGGGFGSAYKVIGGYDFYNGDSNPIDDNGHGTHVAGIIAAKGGITGVAPDASILAYKVLGSDGSGPMSNVIAAIERAMDPNSDGLTDDHADVISMSLGGPGEADDPVCDAVQTAVEAGVMVVVAAGNDGPSMGTVASPGVSPHALTVGAIDRDGSLASFSSRGTGADGDIKPEVSAPGVLIRSTVPSGYSTMSGTSMATPHVSGAAALILQLHPTWTPGQLKSAIVSGSSILSESLWSAGAGGLWVPGGADARLFFDPAIVSYGFAGEDSTSASVKNLGTAVSVTVSTSDWMSMTADGASQSHEWTNVSTVSPTSMSLSAGQSASLQLTVPVPAQDSPEGYFDGHVLMDASTGPDARLPFGFVVLSVLRVHVLDNSGNEVYDPYGGVWVYSIPETDVALSSRGTPASPAPPTEFLLPSGAYSVHAIGHQLLYEYADPYVLSSTVTLPRVTTMDVYLSMSTARAFTLDLETSEGIPIYVKDYRVYCRHEAAVNVSFHQVGIDYSVWADEVFTLPKSKVIYVSDTEATIGISVAGYSYSAGLWDFMKRNWMHIYEFPLTTSYGFYIEADADQQYLLAWEFDGIDSTTPSTLTLVDGEYSVYRTKYDIPGVIDSYWAHGGSHQSAGGEANFFVRRDHYTSMNPFFTGMTRTIFVQGVYSSLYFPGSPYGGFFEMEFYTPNYDELVKADSVSEIYLPSRTFLTGIAPADTSQVIGSGPFYPALHTENTNTTFVLFQPVLRDQSGAKVVGTDYPDIRLYRNSQFVGVYQIAEYMARPDAMRIIDLMGTGDYVARISGEVMDGVNDYAEIELRFCVPANDLDPPTIGGLSMSQRFAAGSIVEFDFTAADDSGSVAAEVWWRGSSSEAWMTVPVTRDGSSFSGAVQTRSTDTAIDLRIKVSDASGNYLQYTASNASMRQVPTRFALSASPTEVGYRNGDASVQLVGYLTDASGLPLNSLVAIPLDLELNGEKIGTILDDYVSGTVHTHNGTIMFDWHFNPVDIFTGPDQYAQVTVDFDLGTYEPHTSTIVLRSVEYTNDLPVITLNSPANNSLIAAGAVIDLSITDSGTVTAEAYLDGVLLSSLTAPWDLDTKAWKDGAHVLRIVATDDQLAETEASYQFEIDAASPAVDILRPEDGSVVPKGWTMEISASDEHLVSVSLSLDGAPFQVIDYPYIVDMAQWSVGVHVAVVDAADAVGHHAIDTVSFEIVEGSLVVALESPSDGSVVRSGTTIEFSVLSFGTATCRWAEYGVWHELGSATAIPTDGWADGIHSITINATDDLGGFDDLDVTFTFDNTAPSVTLVSPADGSFVALGDRLSFAVSDANFDHLTMNLWGSQITSVHPTTSLVLTSAPADGYFSVVVTGYDKAGNQGSASFSFALDSAPPALAVSGVVSGDAVSLGKTLQIEVSDAFLAYVQYSFDSAAMSTLGSPYQVETAGLSSGWHVLSVSAGDYSGKMSSLDMSIYIDTTPPQIVAEVPEEVPEDTTLSLSASITDDYCVHSAELFYELSDGSFTSVLMEGTETEFSTVLPAGAEVWDGMSVFIRAYDSVGNWAESDKVVLHVISGSSDGGVAPGDDPSNGGGTIISWLGSTTGLSVLGLSLSVLVISLAVLRKDRKEDEDDFKGAYGRSSSARAVETRMREMHEAPRIPEPFDEAPRVKEEPRFRNAAPVAAKAEPEEAKAKPLPLIEAMPVAPMKIRNESGESVDEEIDYGELIERELIIPGLKRSIFAEDVSQLEKEFGLDIDQRDPRARPPRHPTVR